MVAQRNSIYQMYNELTEMKSEFRGLYDEIRERIVSKNTVPLTGPQLIDYILFVLEKDINSLENTSVNKYHKNYIQKNTDTLSEEFSPLLKEDMKLINTIK